LIAWLLRNPSRIGPFARFVRRLPRISESLALAIEGTIRAMADH
jgi:hypothetical protein